MGLLGRIKTIVKGKANKAVEKAERADPVAIAKAELREMTEDLGKLEGGVKQAKGQIKIAEGKIEEAQKSADDWKEKATIAKEAGNMELAQKGAERCVEYKDEVERRTADLATSNARFEDVFDRFKAKTAEVDTLKAKIKEYEVKFKTAKALNDLETSETSGAGVKSADRINDMLDIVDEEVAMADASLEIGESEEAKLEKEFASMGASKKSQDLLDSL